MSFNKKTSILLFVLILIISAVILTGCDDTAPAPAPTATAVPTEAAPAATEQPAEAPASPTEEAAVPEETPAEAPAAPTEEAAIPEEQPKEEPAPEKEQPEAEPQTAENTGDQVIASVDGVPLSEEKFVQMTVFNRYQYLNMYYQYAQMYQMYGLPLDSLNEQVEGILGESGRERLGLESIDQLTYDRVLELEAEKDGLEISDEEIYAQMKFMFGYEDDTSEEDPVLGMDSFNIGAEDTTDQADKDAEFREFAENVLADSYGGSVSFDYVKDYAKHILLDNTMFAEELNSRVFESEQVNARHILVEDEETAKEILAKLEAGEEWDKLASENSLDTSNKDNSGSLGWFGRGVMVSEFEDAAFALEPGQISEPVQTAYGYHIIASDGKEVRPLEGDALTAAQNALYDEWSIGLREAHEIQSNKDVWMELVPMEPAFEPPATETEEASTETVEEPVSEAAPAEETVTEAPAETAEEPAAEAAPAEETVTEAPAGTAEEPVAEAAPTEEAAAEEPAGTAETDTDEKYAAAVNGEGVTLEDFVESVTFSRYQYINQYNQYAQMYQMYGLPLDSLTAQAEAILNEEGKAGLGETSIKELTYNIVLDHEAEKAGVEVSKDEIYARLKTMFSYEDPSEEEKGLLGMESFDIAPTVTDDEEDKYAEFEQYAQAVLDRGYDGRISMNYLKNFAKHAILEDKLFDEAIKDRVFEAEQVNARHILVETEETANEILAKLEAGEEWDALAAEYNLDKGTALGWFGRGVMVSEFEEAAFNLEPGEISQPVKTQYGYHIIASDGKEIRPLEGTALETAKNDAYLEWRGALSDGYEIESFSDVWMDAMPSEPVFTPIVTEAQAENTEAAAETEPAAETETAAEEIPAAEPAAEEPAEETAPAEENTAEPPAAEEQPEEAAPAESKSIKRHERKDTDDARNPLSRIMKATETPAEETEAETEPEAAAAEEETPAGIVGSVSGTPISADEFVMTCVFNRYQILAEYQQSAQIYAMFGIPLDEINASYEEYLSDSEESKASLGQESLNNIALFKMAELEAAETGITVSDREVISQMKQISGYTDAEAETESSLGLDSFNLEADETGSGEEDIEFRAYMDMDLEMTFNDKISYDFWKNYVKSNMLVNALLEKEFESRVFEGEQVHARHILVDEEETALEVLGKLDAGEEWDSLAETYNKDSGTDLGWFGRGTMVSEFEDAAFALEPGEISQPVKTQYGYHIIISDGKEMRPLEDSALQAAQQKAAAEWYESLQKKYTVESYSDIWMPLVPTEPVFEPIQIEAAAGEGIPTFTIGGDQTDTYEDTLSIDNTEQDSTALLLNNDQELDRGETTEAPAENNEAAADDELSIDNTEQDNGALLLNNDQELDRGETTEAPAENTESAADEELSIDNTEQDNGALLLNNEGENK